ncbi:hypothetical protein JCM19235_1348 [Vibrio maritimus]|uniref:Uncharacterized protein n=1 Tax=Vibrio maritimus TaxID=990268 RepID=A0A090SUQ0_9VIBR|nr:hypothetical protein JCM19235_1348 [Vibrio maritimus]
MDAHDIELVKALMPDLPPQVIAEKFEVSLWELTGSAYECDFPMTKRLFDARVKNNNIQIREGAIERRCYRCNEFVPFTAEFWHHNRSSNDGASSHCRACQLTMNRLQKEAKQGVA